jgi:hypothetical protein
LKDEIKKKIILKKRLESTLRTCDIGFENGITRRKNTKRNYKDQFSINSILKDEIENKIIYLKKTKKKKRQFKLTCQTRDPCHVTRITSMKGNKKKI